MALTNGQKQALHAAARMMGPAFTDGMRRAVQQRIGGFYSAADKTASRLGFIACMAWYETELEKLGKQLARTRTYWRDELAKAVPGDGLRYRVRQLAKDLGWDDDRLDAWIAGEHMSKGAAADVRTANIYWLRKAVDGLAAMARRQATDLRPQTQRRPHNRSDRPRL